MHSQRRNGKVVRLCSSGLINAYSLCLASLSTARQHLPGTHCPGKCVPGTHCVLACQVAPHKVLCRLAREVGEDPGRVTTFASLTMTCFQNRGSPQEGLGAKCRTGPSLCLAPVAVYLLHLSSQCENCKSNPKLLPSDQHLGEKPESLLAINIPRSKTPDVRAGRAAARGRPGGSSLLSPGVRSSQGPS